MTSQPHSPAPPPPGFILRSRDAAIFLFPLLLLSLFTLLFVFQPERYLRLVIEDGPVEILQACLCFLSSAISLLAARKLQPTPQRLLFWLLVLFAAATFFIGAEEISWGQRLCGWATPEPLREINLQHETTLHNIRGVQSLTSLFSILIGLYGAFAWLFWKRDRSRPADMRNFIVPEWTCTLYFLPAALFFYSIDHVESAQRFYSMQPLIVSSIHQEVVELLLALGILLIALGNRKNVARLLVHP